MPLTSFVFFAPAFCPLLSLLSETAMIPSLTRARLGVPNSLKAAFHMEEKRDHKSNKVNSSGFCYRVPRWEFHVFALPRVRASANAW
jgi:hypothetical protein